MPKLLSRQDLIDFRRRLHANPEVSGEEHETSEAVRHLLSSLQPDALDQIGGTGLIAAYDGANKGKTILFRSELDALPIQEVNSFEHRSLKDGVAHKCGHDGHTAILIGLANKLAKHRPKSGKVVLLFQPAEETGEGATAVQEDPLFSQYAPDLVFALHNLPGFPTGAIVLKEGPFTSAVCSLIYTIHGKTAHAAEPENGLNPIYAVADIAHKAQELETTDPDDDQFALITPVHSRVGDIAYGTAPGIGEVHLTIRAWRTQQLNEIVDTLTAWTEDYCSNSGYTLRIERTAEFSANINDSDSVEIIRQAANQCDLKITSVNHPFRWGEDFGLFTESYSGAMFGIGAGEDCPALHNPDYDFPDELLGYGVDMFHAIARQLLN